MASSFTFYFGEGNVSTIVTDDNEYRRITRFFRALGWLDIMSKGLNLMLNPAMIKCVTDQPAQVPLDVDQASVALPVTDESHFPAQIANSEGEVTNE